MYIIELRKEVKKFLGKHENVARIFYEKILSLSKNPFDASLDIKTLTGKKSHYRLRIGKYRFLYEIRETEILIYFYEADSRGSIYK